MPEVWIWQRIVSPHMVGLAVSLARNGCHVTYVAEQEMSAHRKKLGWLAPQIGNINLILAPDRSSVNHLVSNAAPASIHICQSVRSNGHISYAQHLLSKRGLQQWVAIETVDDKGLLGILKRFEYSRLFYTRRKHIEGILAIGHTTVDWIIARGVPAERVFPFTYFLPAARELPMETSPAASIFRFIFVGQFIRLKRLDLLVKSLASLLSYEFELVVVGAGPLETSLRTEAEQLLPGRVRWVGRLPSNEVLREIVQADCLVLPSNHDGWGAVVSEALMVGTPAICSDACGAAVAVRSSGVGGVFKSGDAAALQALLTEQLLSGRVPAEARSKLRAWGKVLGAEKGSEYLLEILAHRANQHERPVPPWNREKF